MSDRAPTLAVAIPAFNESGGIGEFLTEIDNALRDSTDRLTLVVVDDASTDGTDEAVRSLVPSIKSELKLIRLEENRGHGPALIRAYQEALASGADFVIAVDGDGQFLGTDLRRLLALLRESGLGVCGVRRFRYDPWVRMAMTRALRLFLSAAFAVPTRDANCPLRGYPAPLLAELLADVPEGALVPNLQLTILAARRGDSLVEVDVTHRVRRGGSSRGTMFGGSGGGSAATVRLLRFSTHAFAEMWKLRRSLRGRDAGRARTPSRH
jgi:glycosyltransferase involved in cell wall biosynthesis